jgi:hypothetical protein
MDGRVVRGVAHVDLQLATELATRDFRRLDYEAYTRLMLEAVWDRDRVYDLWAVGQPYDNSIYSATRIEARDLSFRTVCTIRQSLRTAVWRTLSSVVAVGAFLWISSVWVIPWAEAQSLLALGLAFTVLSGTAAAAAVVVNARRIWQAFHSTFIELPADAVLLDMGWALLAALRHAGMLEAKPTEGWVRAVEMPAGGYEVFLDQATPEDSATFAQAFRQMLGPLGDARYLIERDSTSLRNLVYRPLWLLVRKALGLEEDLKAYHRVPDVLASRRERAETLAHYWQHYVGGGRLIYTRTEGGRRILLKARAQQRGQIRRTALEIWQ